jgi:hypothetical protein
VTAAVLFIFWPLRIGGDMQEKANSGDYVLCRNMLVLTLCAAVLGAVFYLRAEKKEAGEKIAAYELVWAEETEEGAVEHKWRYFVEGETGRPRKIEKYSRDGTTGEYVLLETVIIDYPLDEEMREVLMEMYR